MSEFSYATWATRVLGGWRCLDCCAPPQHEPDDPECVCDEDEHCHWCQLVLADGGYGIEGYQFCDESCANEWWEEWCREL